MVTVKCIRKGCGKDFDPAENTPNACNFHPGGPVFHEGLKSWSCCQDVNKPVLDFDEFMAFPGCHEAAHTDEPPKTEAPVKPTPSSASVPIKSDAMPVAAVSLPSGPTKIPAQDPLPTPVPVIEEEDDPTATVPAGTKCRHNACGVLYELDSLHRNVDSSITESQCVYHPKAPIFHEGSKGYLCCKPRVLEFDEFLKMKGCTTGRHVFVPKVAPGGPAEELTEARIDHYQTLSEVHVSVFAKKADPERSTVRIEETHLHLDLYLPNSKRVVRSIELFGPVDSGASTHKYYGTKVEVILKKTDARSWTILEKPTRDLGSVALTFGVSGRTGTIGAKDLILDADNKLGRS